MSLLSIWLYSLDDFRLQACKAILQLVVNPDELHFHAGTKRLMEVVDETTEQLKDAVEVANDHENDEDISQTGPRTPPSQPSLVLNANNSAQLPTSSRSDRSKFEQFN